MFRCNKARIAIIISVLILSGCTQNASIEETERPSIQPPSNIDGKALNSPVSITHTVNNPIDIVYEEITEGTDEAGGIHVNHQILSISGLKDQTVQQKINDRIWQAYEELKSSGLPPFRGIKARIPENALLVDDSIYFSVEGSFNNIISISLSKNVTYAIPNENGNFARHLEGYYLETEFVNEREGLTFDLNTGEEITLAEIFTDGIDYLPLLNDEVVKELEKSQAQEEGWYSMYGGLKLTQPFKGIPLEQKFYLSPNSIWLIFDYDNPQFYSEYFMSQTIQVYYMQLNGNIAITERYYDKGINLYLSEAPIVKSLLWSNDDYDVLFYENYRDEFIQVYRACRLPSQMPESLKEELIAMAEIDQELVNTLNDKLKQENLVLNDETRAYYDCSLYGNTISGYYTVAFHTYYWSSEGDSYQLSKNYTYDATTCKVIEPSDIFCPGYDHKSKICEALKLTTDTMGGLYRDGVKLTPEEDEAEIKHLAENIQIQLSTDSIELITDNAEFSGHRYEPIYTSLTFKEIGCDNLLIFEDN